MLNSFSEPGNLGFAKHSQAPHPAETSKQPLGVPWGYNAQLDGLYSYPSNPQPLYNIQYEGERKHPEVQFKHPQVSAVVKCTEACCQYLNEGARFPLNPSPLRFPAPRHVPAQRYEDLPNTCFTQNRLINPLTSKSAQVNCYPHLVQDSHSNRVNKTRDSSRQQARPAPPQYPIYHYWPQRDWNGQNPPPPPPYPHPPQPKQSNQLQHYSQQPRLVKNQSELPRNVPQRRPTVDYQMQQDYYDFNRGYGSGFLPFTDGIPAQMGDSSCKTNDIHYAQPHHQYAVQNDKVINNQVPDLMYTRHYPNDNLYFNLRASQHNGNVVQMPHHHHRQYEQTTRKRPDLDLRQFLATWEDDEEETRAVEAATDTQGQPFIVLDCSGLEGDALVRVQEKLKGQNVQLFPTKSVQDTGQRQVLDSVERALDQQSNTAYSGTEQYSSQDQSRRAHPVSESYHQIDKHLKDLLQPLDCSKRDGLQPVIPSRREAILQGQSSDNERHPTNETNNPMSFDALVTYYGDNRRSEMAYDLVEITERLVSAADKICNGGNGVEQPNSKESHTLSNHMLPESFLGNNVPFTENYNHTDKPSSAFSDYTIPSGILSQESNKVFAVSSHQSNTQFTIKNIVSPTAKETPNIQNTSSIPDRKDLDFLQEDPEQFIKSTTLKKSDYTKLPKFSPPKKLRRQREYDKNVYGPNCEQNVDSAKIVSKSISFSTFNNAGETYDANENIVTLHAEVQSGEQQSPYLQKYSRVITLSEGLARTNDNNPTNKQALSEQNPFSTTSIAAESSNNVGTPQNTTPDKSSQRTDASPPVSFKLKRIPNSKEWVKIDKTPSPKTDSPLFGGPSNKDICFTSIQTSSPQNSPACNNNNNNTENPSVNNKVSTNLSMPTLEDIHEDSILPFINSPKCSKNNTNHHAVITKPMTVIHSTERSVVSNLDAQHFPTNDTTLSNSGAGTIKPYVKNYCPTDFVKQPEKLPSFDEERPITLIYSSPSIVHPSCGETSFMPPLKLNRGLCDTDNITENSFDYRMPTSPATDDMFDDINRLSNRNGVSFLSETSYLEDTNTKEVTSELNCAASTCEFPFYSPEKDIELSNKTVSHVDNVLCESEKHMSLEFSSCDDLDKSQSKVFEKTSSEQVSCSNKGVTINVEEPLTNSGDGSIVTYGDVVSEVADAELGYKGQSQMNVGEVNLTFSPVPDCEHSTANNEQIFPSSLKPDNTPALFSQCDPFKSLGSAKLILASENKENEKTIENVDGNKESVSLSASAIIISETNASLDSKTLDIKHDFPANHVHGNSPYQSVTVNNLSHENINSSTVYANEILGNSPCQSTTVNNASDENTNSLTIDGGSEVLLSENDSREDTTQNENAIANCKSIKQFNACENIVTFESQNYSRNEPTEDSTLHFLENPMNLENVKETEVNSEVEENRNHDEGGVLRIQFCSGNGITGSSCLQESCNDILISKDASLYSSDTDSSRIIQEKACKMVVEENNENSVGASIENPCVELVLNKNNDSNANEDSDSSFSDDAMLQDMEENVAKQSDNVQVSVEKVVCKEIENCNSYIECSAAESDTHHSGDPRFDSFTCSTKSDGDTLVASEELEIPRVASLSPKNISHGTECFHVLRPPTIGGCDVTIKSDSLAGEDTASCIKGQILSTECAKTSTIGSSICGQVTNDVQKTKHQCSPYQNSCQENSFTKAVALEDNDDSIMNGRCSLNEFDLTFNSATASAQLKSAASLFVQTTNGEADSKISEKNFPTEKTRDEVEKEYTANVETDIFIDQSLNFIEQEQNSVKDLMEYKDNNRSSYNNGIQQTSLHKKATEKFSEKSLPVEPDSTPKIEAPTLNKLAGNDCHNFTCQVSKNCMDKFPESSFPFNQSKFQEEYIEKTALSIASVNCLNRAQHDNDITSDAFGNAEGNNVHESCYSDADNAISNSKDELSTECARTSGRKKEFEGSDSIAKDKFNFVSIHDDAAYLGLNERSETVAEVSYINMADNSKSDEILDLKTIDGNSSNDSQDIDFSGTKKSPEFCESTCGTKTVVPSYNLFLEDCSSKNQSVLAPCITDNSSFCITEVVDKIFVTNLNESQDNSKECEIEMAEIVCASKPHLPSEEIACHTTQPYSTGCLLKSNCAENDASITDLVHDIVTQVHEQDNILAEENVIHNVDEACSNNYSLFKSREETVMKLGRDQGVNPEVSIVCSLYTNLPESEGISLEAINNSSNVAKPQTQSPSSGLTNTNEYISISSEKGTGATDSNKYISFSSEQGICLTNTNDYICINSTDLKDKMCAVNGEKSIQFDDDHSHIHCNKLTSNVLSDDIGSRLHFIDSINHQKLVANEEEESIGSTLSDKSNISICNITEKLNLESTNKERITELIDDKGEKVHKTLEDNLIDSFQIKATQFCDIPLPIGPMPLQSLFVQFSSKENEVAQATSHNTNNCIVSLNEKSSSCNNINAVKCIKKKSVVMEVSYTVEKQQYSDYHSRQPSHYTDCDSYLGSTYTCSCDFTFSDKLVDYSSSSSNSPESQVVTFSPNMTLGNHWKNDVGNDNVVVYTSSSDTESVARGNQSDIIKNKKSPKEESNGDDSDDELLSIYVSENLLGESSLSCNDEASNSSMSSISAEDCSLYQEKIPVKDTPTCVVNVECTCNVLGQFKCFNKISSLESECSSFIDEKALAHSYSNCTTVLLQKQCPTSNLIHEQVSDNEPGFSREQDMLDKSEDPSRIECSKSVEISILEQVSEPCTSRTLFRVDKLENLVDTLSSNRVSASNEPGMESVQQSISEPVKDVDEKLPLNSEMGDDELKDGIRVEELPLRLPLSTVNENKMTVHNSEPIVNPISNGNVTTPSFENVPPSCKRGLFKEFEQINLGEMPPLEPVDNSILIGKHLKKSQKLSDDKIFKNVRKEKNRVRIKFKGGNWKKRSQSNKIPSGHLEIHSRTATNLDALETDVIPHHISTDITQKQGITAGQDINEFFTSAQNAVPVNYEIDNYNCCSKVPDTGEDVEVNLEHFSTYRGCYKENVWDLEGKDEINCSTYISLTSENVLNHANVTVHNDNNGVCETYDVSPEILQCLGTELDGVDVKSRYVIVVEDDQSLEKHNESGQDHQSIGKDNEALVNGVDVNIGESLLHNMTMNTRDPLVDSAYWNDEKSLEDNVRFNEIEPIECNEGFNDDVSEEGFNEEVSDNEKVPDDNNCKTSDPCDTFDHYCFHEHNLHREYQFVPIDDFCGLETLAEVVSSACITSEGNCFNELSSEATNYSENKHMQLSNVPYTMSNTLKSDGLLCNTQNMNSDNTTDGLLSPMMDLHYEDVSNCVHDVSNWPYVEEEVHDCDYIDIHENKDDSVDLKCRLRWDRIFNVSNSKKRKFERSNENKSRRELELGPAKVEVRLRTGADMDAWKVKKCRISRPPVVNVGRLILQRDPELTSYSEESRASSLEDSDDNKPQHSPVYSEDNSLPRVIIRKKSGAEYTSYLRVCDNWQPVVELKRSDYIDKLALEHSKANDKRAATWAMRRTMMQKKKKKLAIKRPNSDAIPDVIAKSPRLQDDSNGLLQSFHCRSCLLRFDTQAELVDHRYSEHCGRRELHHCLLCQRSYSTFDRYLLHVSSRSHRHLELCQRSTIHAVHRLFTDSDCPSLRPLSAAETQALDWWPRHNGYKHFYHQPTPLQIALQEKTDFDPS